MTLIGKSFSASEIYEDYEKHNLVAPKGGYDLQLDSISLKPTQNGNGKFLLCIWKIKAPSYQGLSAFDILNIENPNPRTEQLAEQRYRIMVKASGHDNITIEDRQLLVGIICSADLDIKPYSFINPENGKPESRDKNVITKLHSSPRFLSSTAGVSEADTTSVCTETAPSKNDFDDEIPF